tara:strand:+ start:155 stop:703 length:549 start_codon:yes stop_codon:yes gene_type:complete
MITVKYKKNINIDRALRNVRTAASVLLNDIAIPVKEGWDNALQTGDFSNNSKNKSTQDLHGGTPLNVSGKLAKSNKILRASPKKLKAVVKNTAKSSKNYKIRKPNGKIYRGKRKSAPVFYGYYLNKKDGFTTASNSLIPNKKVKSRNFTDKTLDDLYKNPKYIKAKKKFAKNLETSMRMAAK